MSSLASVRFKLIGFFVIAAFVLYGRSLPYGFVYDDHWRVENNTAVQSLKRIDRFFWDRSTSSSLPALQRDNYRPLVTLSFAVDDALAHGHPGFFRAENIFLHGMNAALVAILASLLFPLSLSAQVMSGLLFLVHPVQSESVVWISERTNTLGLFFMLLTWLSWIKKPSARFYGLFVAALLTRESAVVLPALLLLTNFYRAQPRRWRHYAAMAVAVGLYFGARGAVLGQIKMADYWGGGFLANIANVASFWLEYPRALFWPAPLQVTYAWLPVFDGWGNGRVWFGLGSLLAITVLIAAGWHRAPSLAFLLATFLILWLPASNLAPLTTPFAERLLYPLMVPAAWMLAQAAHRLSEQARGVCFILMICLGLLTFRRLPDWQSDLSLWQKTTETTPQSWFGWANLGEIQKNRALAQGTDSAPALVSLKTALSLQVPAGTAGTLFFYMAELYLRDGDVAQAQIHAERAIALNPALAELWKIRRTDVITSRPQP